MQIVSSIGILLVVSDPISNFICSLSAEFAQSMVSVKTLPDQAGQNVGPDLASKLFDTLMVFLQDFRS